MRCVAVFLRLLGGNCRGDASASAPRSILYDVSDSLRPCFDFALYFSVAQGMCADMFMQQCSYPVYRRNVALCVGGNWREVF